MILDTGHLQTLMFLAHASVPPREKLSSHADPMEEIYFVLSGSGEMGVDDENRQVGPGDATWIPTGSSHRLLNNGEADLVILVVASPNW